MEFRVVVFILFEFELFSKTSIISEKKVEKGRREKG